MRVHVRPPGFDTVGQVPGRSALTSWSMAVSFGVGAVGGYAVLHFTPVIVADEVLLDVPQETAGRHPWPVAPVTACARLSGE